MLPGVSERLLVLSTRALNDLSQCVKNLAGNADGLEEVGLSGGVDQLLARVMPVEVHDGFLKTNSNFISPFS